MEVFGVGKRKTSKTSSKNNDWKVFSSGIVVAEFQLKYHKWQKYARKMHIILSMSYIPEIINTRKVYVCEIIWLINGTN